MSKGVGDAPCYFVRGINVEEFLVAQYLLYQLCRDFR